MNIDDDAAVGIDGEPLGLDMRIDQLPLSAPVAPHTVMTMDVSAFQPVRPLHLGMHGSQRSLDVSGVEGVIGFPENFAFVGHQVSPSSQADLIFRSRVSIVRRCPWNVKLMDREAQGHPRLQTALQGAHARDALAFELKRHPGARGFVGSGAVKHQLSVLEESQPILVDLIGVHPEASRDAIGHRGHIEVRAEIDDRGVLAGI
jgi:hypothetical protein